MKPKQTTLRGFLDLPSSSQSDEENQYTPSPQKGAIKLPEMWTRVKSRDQMSHSRISVFDIEKDLDANKTLKAVRAQSTREGGEILFDPDSWKGRSEELKMETSKLEEDELREYAVKETQIR